jgi:hypothetical protein
MQIIRGRDISWGCCGVGFPLTLSYVHAYRIPTGGCFGCCEGHMLFEFMQANPGTKWRKLGLTPVVFWVSGSLLHLQACFLYPSCLFDETLWKTNWCLTCTCQRRKWDVHRMWDDTEEHLSVDHDHSTSLDPYCCHCVGHWHVGIFFILLLPLWQSSKQTVPFCLPVYWSALHQLKVFGIQ